MDTETDNSNKSEAVKGGNLIFKATLIFGLAGIFYLLYTAVAVLTEV